MLSSFPLFTGCQNGLGSLASFKNNRFTFSGYFKTEFLIFWVGTLIFEFA